MSYFNNFPKINYFNKETRNIVLKAAIISGVFKNTDVFYTYIIPEGYRADRVADEVYGNPFMDWVIYFSNNIIDPYYEWPIDSRNFKGYLEKKYNKTIFELQSTIHHYKYTGLTNESAEDIANKSWTMTKETYDNSTVEEKSGWSPVYTYDYEDDLNDSRRSIKLLSNVYLNQIINELSKVFQ